jgi:hypothetical protein
VAHSSVMRIQNLLFSIEVKFVYRVYALDYFLKILVIIKIINAIISTTIIIPVHTPALNMPSITVQLLIIIAEINSIVIAEVTINLSFIKNLI